MICSERHKNSEEMINIIVECIGWSVCYVVTESTHAFISVCISLKFESVGALGMISFT